MEAKFKVGDKVKVVATLSQLADISIVVLGKQVIGYESTIRIVDTSSPVSLQLNEPSYKLEGYDFWFSESHLKAI